MSLSQVLADKAALAYFIQYLEVNGGLSLVRCWLDIENFRSAVQLSDVLCTHNITREQLEDNLDVRYLSPLPSSRLDHDSLSVSTDCDSITADSNSLCDYSSITISDAKTDSKRCDVKESNCDKDISDISSKLHKLDVKSTKQPENCAISVYNERKIAEKICQELLDDALQLFKKFIAQEAPQSIECSEDMRNNVVEGICSEEGVLDLHCFDSVQKYVYEKMEQHFESFFQSHYHCKFQIDVLTSGNINLQDVLYNESVLFYFMEFLEQESSRNLLEFWLAASNFRQQLLDHNLNPDEAQKDAVVLYDKYFSLQAICPLGFGDKIRFLIEENICREGGPLPDCFYHPLRIIETILERQYLKSFLSSQLYFKYLSELISTVQTNGYMNISLGRSTNSDCSSEISISAQNTLLAMGETHRNKSSRADMNIDTRQLYDPDSLWKRTKNTRLSFGRINEMGRFVTDMEPKPDYKSESRLTRAMKRFISLEESKTKEEMAWQVAEMIVKDITSITLAHVPNSTQS